jgi:eukaryotic-like serine/threonine-protein kinase
MRGTESSEDQKGRVPGAIGRANLIPCDEMGGEIERVLGRYVLYDEIASGGMACVYIARLLGPVGFSRTVAIKTLHAQFAKDPEFVAMFLDEARLAARIRHPNVVSTLDVVALSKELFIVMDYIQGETLSRLARAARIKSERIPLPIVSSIVTDVLDGLHAAHEAKDEHGQPLHIVHRDVSPHNVIVGRDGIARVLDFGVAKAVARVQTTREGQVKGKFAYMSPEQITRQPVDRRADVFAASIVLWEALTGDRLFAADDPAAVVARVMTDPIPAPSALVPDLPRELDAIVLRGLARDPGSRFATAEEMARALEAVVSPARPAEVGKWVGVIAGGVLAVRAKRIAEIESQSSDVLPAPSLASSTLSAPRPPETTQATDLSAAAPSESGRGRRPLRVVGALVAVAAIGLALTLALRTRNATTAASSAGPPTTSSPPASSPVPSVAPTSSTPPEPAATVAASVSASAAIAPIAAPPARRPVTPHVAPTAAPKTDCNPPYTFDENGVKHFKRGCL